jgi:cytochrome c oxidase accessory protein FixG
MNAPHPDTRVLPTLNADGTRNRIRPRLYKGPIHQKRRSVGIVLLVLFAALPLLRVNGKPSIFLDVVRREFTFFGRTFLATDGVVLMLTMLTIFALVFWVTALVGRAWCGWACPQTVYMEFLIRPIERWFEGKREQQLRLDKQGFSWRRLAKNFVFLLLSFVLGNIFLSYFVGAETLRHWMSHTPSQHPSGFLVMLVTAGLVFFDFAYFREQMCTVICPYARLQSVLLDRRSLLIGYDERRGEPRGKGKPKPGDGDCIDCNACVVSCPTGIDIRQGLQLECIACGQCADACDSIMARVAKPPGLIRYASQDELKTGQLQRLLRPRIVIYSAVLGLLVTSLAVLLGHGSSADVILLRGIGAPFTITPDAINNQIRVKIRNRSSSDRRYQIELIDLQGAKVIAPEAPLFVASTEQRSTSLFVLAPPSAFKGGERLIRFRVSDGAGYEAVFPYKLLGPSR